MGRLIRFEFRKLFRSKYFYILAGIGLAFVVLNLVTLIVMSDIMEELGQGDLVPYSAYLSAKSALGASFTTIAAIFIAIFACDDYMMGTLKNIVGKGYNRFALFYSKYIVSLIATILMLVINVLFAFVIGQIVWQDGVPIDDNVALIVLGQLLLVVAYHAIFFAIAYSFGRLGPSIAVNILGPSAIGLILALVDLFIENEEIVTSNYWLDGILLNFVSTATDPDLIPISIALLVVYTLIANGVGVLIASRKQY